MNKKLIIVIVTIGLFVIIILTIWLLSLKGQKPGNAISIPGTSQAVTTNNFIPSAQVTYGRAVVLYFDSDFSIQYDNVINTFTITFTSNNIPGLSQLRTKAEGILLSKLEVSQADACKLKITEQIQQNPGLNLSAYTFPLSFCGQNDNFPK